MNKFRNEMEVKLGAETILLRPTFENIAAMESNVGSVAWLGWKYSRGVRLDKDGHIESTGIEAAVKSVPSLSETAAIIYYNQAASKPEDPSQKKFSLEEIWDLVLQEGAPITRSIVLYLSKITAGDKAKDVDEISEAEKKS